MSLAFDESRDNSCHFSFDFVIILLILAFLLVWLYIILTELTV